MGSMMVCGRTKPSASFQKSDVQETGFKRADSMNKYHSHYHNSIFSQADYNPLTHHTRPLTDRQKELVQKSWTALTTVPDPVKTVMSAFVRMFVLTPESMKVFKILNNDLSSLSLDEKELLKNTVMRKHFDLVFGFLGETIKHLSDPNKPSNASMTWDLGRRHMWYGAKKEFIKALCDGFLFAFEKTLWPDVDAEILEAWESLFQLIAYEWAHGFEKEEEEKKSGKPKPDLTAFVGGHFEHMVTSDLLGV